MRKASGGSGGFFGASKNRHDLLDTRIDPPVADVHGGVGAEEFADLGEPTSVAIGVVPGDKVAN